MNPVINQLDAVSLTELTERAGLLQRMDRKYVVPVAALVALLGELPDGTRVLSIDGRRSFGYRSVYFDTDDLLSYRLTALGRRRRFKIRTRSYLDRDVHLLEVKTRGPRGSTRKQRVPYDGDGDGLSAADRIATDVALREAGALAPKPSDHLRPVVTTHYRRITLLLPASDSRVTIDTGLSWSLDETGPRQHLGPYAIVETKTAGRPAAMDRALWRGRHRPSSFSKFGTGLAALRPHLPAHRWRPTLNRYLNLEESAS